MNTVCILAKLKVVSVDDQTNGLLGAGDKLSEKVRLEAVTADTPENKTFSDATPSGSLELNITNKDAWGFFVVGAEHKVKIYPKEG